MSSRDNKYIAVFYIYDDNFIKGTAIKNRNSNDLLWAYEIVYKYCEERGFKPKLHTMDIEMSLAVEEFIAEQNAKV